MSWTDLCRPKTGGGVGIRRVQDLCHAAVLKKIWRLCISKTLWTSWMQNRYLNNTRLWDSTACSLDSGTWKHIQKMKATALECMQRVIANGQSDPWLNEGRLVELINHNIPHITNTHNWRVSDIIHNGNWTLNIPALSPYWHSISCIRISDNPDTWKWISSPTGVFSSAIAWNAMREPSPSFTLHNVIWFPSASPKMSCCLP